MKNQKITTFFCDIGGVLLTNGWDRKIRAQAAERFGIDPAEMEERHQLTFYLYEIGKITLNEYLKNVVFYTSRSFSFEEFIAFMYAQSEADKEMLNFVRQLKQEYQLKIVLLSNEGKELSDERIQKFGLKEFADFFVVSSYVNLRKPDKDIFLMALNLVKEPPNQIVYLDDRQLFVDVAADMGIHAIRHVNLAKTSQAFQNLPLKPRK